jgi:hypothetical protein
MVMKFKCEVSKLHPTAGARLSEKKEKKKTAGARQLPQPDNFRDNRRQ